MCCVLFQTLLLINCIRDANISESDTYKCLLTTNHAMTPCDSSFKSFVIQEFSSKDSSLKVANSVVVYHKIGSLPNTVYIPAKSKSGVM